MQSEFIKLFEPTENVAVSPETIEKYKSKVPKELVAIWEKYGLGKFGKGMIELINPQDYEEILSQWFGKKEDNIVPIAISSFDHLIYYVRNKVPDDSPLAEDRVPGEDYVESINFINPYINEYQVICYYAKGFFDDFFTCENEREDWLQEEYFKYAYEQVGKLKIGEIYSLDFKKISKKKAHQLYDKKNICSDVFSAIEIHKELLKRFKNDEIEFFS